MQDRLCYCLSKVFGLGGHLMPLQQVLMDELMDYLTLSPLSHPSHPSHPQTFPHPPISPSPHTLPAVAAVAALWGNEEASCLLRSHLTLTNSAMHLVCMCALSVHADPSDWLWDLWCAFENVCVCVCGCVWPGHLVLCMQAWSRLISRLQKLAIKS